MPCAAEMTTPVVINQEKLVKSSETERKEHTSSLMRQILSSENLNSAILQVVRNKWLGSKQQPQSGEIQSVYRREINYFKIGSMKTFCRETDKHIRFRL